MKINRVKIEQISEFLPGVISFFCLGLIAATEFLQLDWIMAALLITFLGIGAYFFMHNVNQASIAEVKAIEMDTQGIFSDGDPTEKLLEELEELSMAVSEISAKQIEISRIQTEDAVTAISNRFVHLSEDINRMIENIDKTDSEQLHHIKLAISDILMSMQFQDRTSQILQHASNSLDMFKEEIRVTHELRKKGGEPEYDLQKMLDRITAGFTTEEQHALAGVVHTQNKSEKSNVELF